MKRFLFLLLLGALLAGSCRRSQVVMPEFRLMAVDTTVVRHEVPGTFRYSFVSIANADKSPALQAIEEANIFYFFALQDFRGTPREAVGLSIEQLMGYVDELDEEARSMIPEMELIVESQARVVDSLLVYTITNSSFAGGAHGIYVIDNHNYSIAGGYELVLSDLLDARQQEALQALIRQKLYERFNVTGDEGLAAQGVFPETIYATENFEVTDDGITFYYNPYDIASYSVGGIEVSVTAQELQELQGL